MWVIIRCLLLAIISPTALGLDDGLCLTPPMGWLSWERFRGNINCRDDPENCISRPGKENQISNGIGTEIVADDFEGVLYDERLYKTMADLLVSEGYRDAGYHYVIVDDSWMTMSRDSNGRLVADPDRFPSGIDGLANYMHARGLKLGLYEDFGTKTCQGFPGSKDHLKVDVQTFADWGVDYIKLDGCNYDPADYILEPYPPVAEYIHDTGRDMVYNCKWAASQLFQRLPVNYTKVREACHTVRNHGDIEDSWDEVKGIIAAYGKNLYNFAGEARPGFFNDPDMLIIGDYGLSYEQERTQMAMWSIWASPLIMSNDLRNMRPSSKALLLNASAIAINQDPLGKQATRIDWHPARETQVWSKPILPDGSVAFVLLYTGDHGRPRLVSIQLADMGLDNPSGYHIIEVFDNVEMGTYTPGQIFSYLVNPSGVFFGKAVPVEE